MWTAGCCIGYDLQNGQEKVESIAVIGNNLPSHTLTTAITVRKLQLVLADPQAQNPVILFPGQPACSEPGNSYILKVKSKWQTGHSSCVSNLSHTWDQINIHITRTILFSCYLLKLTFRMLRHTPSEVIAFTRFNKQHEYFLIRRITFFRYFVFIQFPLFNIHCFIPIKNYLSYIYKLRREILTITSEDVYRSIRKV